MRRRLLCDELPLPELANFDTSIDRTAGVCWNCHQYIDDLGNAFEQFDPTGRPVGGQPNAGEVRDVMGADSISFGSLDELASILSTSPKVQRCVSRQWMRYAIGRLEQDGQNDYLGEKQSFSDSCSIDQMVETLDTDNFKLNTLPTAFVASDAFRYVRK